MQMKEMGPRNETEKPQAAHTLWEPRGPVCVPSPEHSPLPGHGILRPSLNPGSINFEHLQKVSNVNRVK